MLGIATGLAREGLVPFVYSIATFATMRCYEQFRNGPVLHRLPVRVVGIGGGFAYGHAGPTHHAIEDLTIARTLPGVTVVAPADGAQTRTVLRASRRHAGPVYLRIDKTDHPDIAALDGRFAFDRPVLVRPGRDVLLLSTGSIVHETLKAADEIETHGISAAVGHLAHLPFRGGIRWPGCCSVIARSSRSRRVRSPAASGRSPPRSIAEERLGCGLTRLGVEALGHGSGSRPYLLATARARRGLDRPPRRHAAWPEGRGVNPRTSIVLPCRNQADHLGRSSATICALLDGTSFELIVVPNASVDRTRDIADEVAGRDGRVRVVDNPAGGWGASVRLGLDAARGSVLATRTAPAPIRRRCRLFSPAIAPIAS